MSWWNKVSNIGVSADMNYRLRSRIRISNQASVASSVITFSYLVYELLFLPPRPEHQVFWFYTMHITLSFSWVPVFTLNKLGWNFAARLFMILLLSTLLFTNSLAVAQPFRSEFYFFALAAFSFIIFDDLKIIVPLFMLQASLFLWVALTISNKYPDVLGADGGLVIRVVLFFVNLFLVLYFMNRETMRYHEEVEIKNSQLSAEQDTLQKQNFVKDKLFSIISHDLRSPLASLHSLLGLYSNKYITDEEFKQATVGLEKQVHQLRNSLDELLTWSKSQIHGINPKPELINLKAGINEVIATNRLIARNKKINIVLNVQDDSVVWCDSNMFTSVMTNLVTNAIKFTNEGGTVTIGAYINENQVCIQVEDNGIGILEENLKKILDPLDLYTTQGTNREKGTGLGLVMCKEFVAKNHGTLTIKSEVGKGSVFIIQLPRDKS